MRSTAADHRTQCHDSIVAIAFSNLLGDQRQLISTRTTNNGNVVVAYLSLTFECVQRTRQQAVIDETVEATDNNSNFCVGCRNGAFDYLHGPSCDYVFSFRIEKPR